MYIVYIYIYIYAHPPPPPNGPTADGSRVLARSRQKTTKQETNKNQQTKKNKKTKKTKKNIFSKTMGLGPPKDGFFGCLEKKMVFLVRNHLFLEKKMVLPGQDLQKQSFSREKDGFTRTRPPKTIFFSRKRWFFQDKISKNRLFLEKKMVFRRAAAQKQSFSREKDGFEPKKPSFSRENQKKPSLEGPSPIVLEKMVFLFFLVFLVFSRKRWFFGSKPSFSREKDCFEQPSFEKPSFSREKDGFTRRRPPKTIFFSRKRWFYQDKTSGNHLFLEKKMVFPGQDL